MLTTDYVSGAPNWVDLGSGDVPASVEFYGALFGWEFASAGPEAGGYGMFVRDGRTVAAVGPHQGEGAKPAWTVYFQTADADATAKSVEEAGGTVRAAPMDIFDQGRMAHFTDPTGAEFAVWQPGGNKGLDAVTDPWTLCWTESFTPDAARSKAFYAGVLGWEYEDMPLPPGAVSDTYTVASPTGGGSERAHAGLMQLGPDMLPDGTGYWQPYFETPDADATVAEATRRGAAVLMGPVDMPGVGRMAMLTDPQGAFFAVITSAEAAA
ncbi:VOC family protein [Streptomyces sp. NPDC060194]|uniref:VOC family protein n=1 Tax=Streptomyces sp. NPDC060194 TaxID=3347069 RepID=UPI00364B1B28